MNDTLYIFDVSPFVHAGSVNKRSFLNALVDVGVRCVEQRTPCGGISLIMNSIASIENTGDFVFCCDRNPTIKKEMSKGYKENRNHRREIEVEKGVAEYILKLCGATVLAYDGYEADDIIYSLVKKLHDRYKHIYIYTGDSDMYFLVDDIVSIRAHSSRGKDVNIQNYSTVIKKDKNIPYNSTTIAKIICGDTSDCIPGVPASDRQKMIQYFYNPVLLPHCGNKEIVKYHMGIVAPQYTDQVDIVFPLEIESVPTTFSPLNYAMLHDMGQAINNRFYRDRGSKMFDPEPYITDMQSRGLYLEDY